MWSYTLSNSNDKVARRVNPEQKYCRPAYAEPNKIVFFNQTPKQNIFYANATMTEEFRAINGWVFFFRSDPKHGLLLTNLDVVQSEQQAAIASYL